MIFFFFFSKWQPIFLGPNKKLAQIYDQTGKVVWTLEKRSAQHPLLCIISLHKHVQLNTWNPDINVYSSSI